VTGATSLAHTLLAVYGVGCVCGGGTRECHDEIGGHHQDARSVPSTAYCHRSPTTAYYTRVRSEYSLILVRPEYSLILVCSEYSLIWVRPEYSLVRVRYEYPLHARATTARARAGPRGACRRRTRGGERPTAPASTLSSTTAGGSTGRRQPATTGMRQRGSVKTPGTFRVLTSTTAGGSPSHRSWTVTDRDSVTVAGLVDSGTSHGPGHVARPHVTRPQCCYMMKKPESSTTAVSKCGRTPWECAQVHSGHGAEVVTVLSTGAENLRALPRSIQQPESSTTAVSKCGRTPWECAQVHSGTEDWWVGSGDPDYQHYYEVGHGRLGQIARKAIFSRGM
jgi:hypothetical protein